jgi:hypothetical protein
MMIADLTFWKPFVQNRNDDDVSDEPNPVSRCAIVMVGMNRLEFQDLAVERSGDAALKTDTKRQIVQYSPICFGHGLISSN